MSRAGDSHGWVESWAWPIIELGPLPGCADLVLLRLAAHGGADGTTFVSARSLAPQVGRSDRAVREALDALRDRGIIDGDPAPRKRTIWRFVTDPTERDRLRRLRTRPAQPFPGGSADPSRAASAEHLRTFCGASANPSRGEVEGEGEDSLSLNVVEGRGKGEGKISDLSHQRSKRERLAGAVAS